MRTTLVGERGGRDTHPCYHQGGPILFIGAGHYEYLKRAEVELRPRQEGTGRHRVPREEEGVRGAEGQGIRAEVKPGRMLFAHRTSSPGLIVVDKRGCSEVD